MINNYPNTRMDQDRVFYCALAASLCIHCVVLIRLSYSNVHYRVKPIKKLEVTYQAVSPKAKEKKISSNRHKEIEGKQLVKAPKEHFRSRFSPADFINKSISKFSDTIKIHQKQPSKIHSFKANKKISVPFIKSEKITNPKYLNYHQIIRQKIRDRAYAYANNSEFEAGEVYLTFVLLSDGSLKQIKLIEEKTSAAEYIRGIGLRSIKESSPFPPFPKDLNYPELSFNVVISFEIKD